MYEGRLEEGMVLTAPGNDGQLGYRRVKLIAGHADTGWIFEELPSRLSERPYPQFGRAPEENLRIVFVPEEEDDE
jgi:hypothetical protein